MAYLALPDTDSDANPGTAIRPEYGYSNIRELRLDQNLSPSLWYVNMFCTEQCSCRGWNPNPSQYLNPCPAM